MYTVFADVKKQASQFFSVLMCLMSITHIRDVLEEQKLLVCFQEQAIPSKVGIKRYMMSSDITLTSRLACKLYMVAKLLTYIQLYKET